MVSGGNSSSSSSPVDIPQNWKRHSRNVTDAVEEIDNVGVETSEDQIVCDVCVCGEGCKEKEGKEAAEIGESCVGQGSGKEEGGEEEGDVDVEQQMEEGEGGKER